MIPKKILKIDSRNKHFHKEFGSTTDFVTESNFGVGIPIIIEQPGQVDCTEISTIKVAYSQTKNSYDVDKAWAKTPHTDQGATPQQTFGSAIKNGLFNLLTQVIDFPFVSYVQANTGERDSFDNTRSAMTLAQSSCTVASNFYYEWLNLAPNAPVPDGKTLCSEHDWLFVDWIVVNGETLAKVDFHIGINGQQQFQTMTRAQFNTEMSKSGCGSFMPMNKAVSTLEVRSLFQTALDYINNIILQISRNISLLKPNTNPITTVQNSIQVTPTPQKVDMITKWAHAIAIAEGARADLNNPLDLKVSTLTQSWGASNGMQATDGGWIAKFDTYAQGFLAGYNFLKLGCEDELKNFHQARTLQLFMEVFAGNPPQGYIQSIATALGVSLDVEVSTFLS